MVRLTGVTCSSQGRLEISPIRWVHNPIALSYHDISASGLLAQRTFISHIPKLSLNLPRPLPGTSKSFNTPKINQLNRRGNSLDPFQPRHGPALGFISSSGHSILFLDSRPSSLIASRQNRERHAFLSAKWAACHVLRFWHLFDRTVFKSSLFRALVLFQTSVALRNLQRPDPCWFLFSLLVLSLDRIVLLTLVTPQLSCAIPPWHHLTRLLSCSALVPVEPGARSSWTGWYF